MIRDENELDEVLTRPGPVLVDFIRSVSSPLLVLGAGGKMGPTLAVLARRAAELAGHRSMSSPPAGSRTKQPGDGLRRAGSRPCRSTSSTGTRRAPPQCRRCHLSGRPEVRHAPESLAHLGGEHADSGVCGGRFASSRIVALSTGNVYPLVPVTGGGARETTPLTPLGEYANAAVARERIFEFFSGTSGRGLHSSG